MRRLIILTVILLAGLPAMTRTANAQRAPYVIPEFSFFRLDDDAPFTREDLEKGKQTVFIFFSTTCDHCQRETEAISKNFGDFSQASLYFVSKDSKSDIRKYMDTYGKTLWDQPSVTVLYDPRSEFVLKFNPSKYPSIYVYTPTRQLVKHFDGETPIAEIIGVVK